MPAITITLDLGTDPWTDVRREQLVHVTEPFRVGGLPGGMASGKTSVAFDIPLPDGRHVLAETSLELFLAAADALRARYGDNAPRGRDA